MLVQRRLSVLALMLAAPAAGQTLPFTIDSSVSALDLETTFELRMPGTLLGDHDPMTNPGGTQTRPGIFGGSGNQPINIQLDLIGDLDVLSPVDGGFDLTPDLTLGAGLVENLDLTLIVGGAGAVDLTLRLTYDTFRTIAPGSLFLSLIPIEIPLGSAALGNVTLVQTASVPALLAATATPGVFDVTALVPVDLTFDFDFNGQVTPVGPVPVLLPLRSVADLGACSATLDGGAQTMTSQMIPAPVPLSIPNIPLPLPTILPPGGIANLLMSVDLDEIVFDSDLDLTLSSSAPESARTESYCVAAPNSAGLGALLDVQGSTSIAADDIVFGATGLPASSFGFLLMGPGEDFVAGFGGSQGNLCLGGHLSRFSDHIQNSGAGGSIQFDPDLTQLPSGVVLAPGETWRFQYWFRDGNPTPTSNTTDAQRVMFCH